MDFVKTLFKERKLTGGRETIGRREGNWGGRLRRQKHQSRPMKQNVADRGGS